MTTFPRMLLLAVLAGALFFARGAAAQTFSGGVQTYPSLSGASVVLNGRVELRLTAATSVLAGCTINLTSSDAAVVFTNVRPSVVASTYLSQITVNGAAAVSGTNVRVVQYGLGTIVLPHAPSFQPLQVFSGPNFTGTALSLSQYTYYNTAASLGSLNRAISSFRLKRGYMAVFSTQTNGAGPSRTYVAQDGDIDVGQLPGALDNSIQFVRVLPWHWVSKKGASDIGPSTLDASWFYNWNNDGNVRQSTLDYEFVPIRQQRWWPALPTNKPESNHLSGFNEPDNPVEDAYTTLDDGSVDTAIAVWPELLSTGLRVGSPAITDGGEAWLYDFIDKADAANLRVDYVAVHFYRCGYTASQLYDWLYNIYVRTGRPLWVTEFNNGANWTTCADPTYAQNATRIGEFIEMMDNAPFIERYAVYSAVEATRQMVYDGGGLTPAGVAYYDNASPVGYQQAVPATGRRGLAHFAFEDNALDSSGLGNNGLAAGPPTYAAGQRGQAIQLDAANGFVQLPANVANAADFSFAGWVKWGGGANWQRIFDFGDDTTHYMFLTPKSGSNTLRFVMRNGGAEQYIETSALPSGVWKHVAVTLSGGTARIYVDGVQAVSGSISITPAQISPARNFFGRSQFAADPLFNGQLDDVRLADYAFTGTQVFALRTNTPPAFASAAISGGNATQGVAYSGTLTATDADAGDTLTYSKLTGPDWLQIAANGALSGTPTFSDEGVQEFTVGVTDAAGAMASAVLTITLPSVLGNGTWSSDANGIWSDTTKWASAFPANGVNYTANFSTLNITASRTVTLDTARTIGILRFGDTSGSQNWTLAASGGAMLTLATGTTTSPAIVVAQNTATISAPLAGTAGFTKSGGGTLVLAAANTLSGDVYIDTGSNTSAEGTVRLAHPDVLDNATSISIRTNNAGSSTLALDGVSGGVSVPAPLSLTGRSGAIPAIRNVSGTNTLGGGITLNVGGGNYYFQSDAGTLVLGGAITTAATTARTLTFFGAGNYNISGVINNGSATMNLVKENAGTLAFSAGSTFTGNVTINGGTLSLTGTGALFAGGWNNTAVLTVNAGATLELDRWGFGPAGTYRTQSLGGLDYGPARFVINGGTIRYTGGAAGLPLNPSESPYGPGFTIGGSGATLDAAKAGDVWTVKNDSRGLGVIASDSGGMLTLAGVGNGIFDKVLPGAGGLNKTGAGLWTLTQANTYTGATNISGGTLFISGSIAGGAVTVASGGSLGGTGTVGGAVSVQSGGALVQGSGIGKLTVSGAVTLQAGSTTRLDISKSAGTCDVIAAGGVLTYGGTLMVTNLAGTPAAGESYKLFLAPSYSGSFFSFSLPALDLGLRWDTSALATTGTIRVVYDVTAYAGWAPSYALPSGQGGMAADPDRDGLQNGFEWLHGGNPLAVETDLQPQVAVVSGAVLPGSLDAQKSYLTLTARVRKTLTGATLAVQAAVTPDGFDSAGSEDSITSFQVGDLGEFETRTWIYTQPVDVSHRAFMRLKLIGN